MVWDPVWENIFSSIPWGKYPPEELIRFVARNFYAALQRNRIKLLEMGCGPGANLWYMAREGFSVYGIEGSESAVEQAIKRLNEECGGWNGEIKVGDMRQLSFADSSFDGVIDNVAVYCNSYKDSQAIYREMLRVAKPGGKLYSKTPAAGSYGDGTGESVGKNAWKVDRGPFQGMGYARFTEWEEIADLFVGWVDITVDQVTHTLEGTGASEGKKVKYWLIQANKSE